MKNFSIIESRRVGSFMIYCGASLTQPEVWRCWEVGVGVPGVKLYVEEFADELSCYYAFIDRYYRLLAAEEGAA